MKKMAFFNAIENNGNLQWLQKKSYSLRQSHVCKLYYGRTESQAAFMALQH